LECLASSGANAKCDTATEYLAQSKDSTFEIVAGQMTQFPTISFKVTGDEVPWKLAASNLSCNREG
jgi:hypothetical protein